MITSVKPIRLLIAGCGDLGTRVAKLVLKNTGSRVWGLRRTQTNNESMPPGFSWLSVDLSKPESMSVLPKGITHILFSATPDVRSESDYRQLYLNGLQNIVQLAESPALERVIFISSSAVYGEHVDEWVNEDTPVSPSHFNGRVLIEAEHWLLGFGQSRGLTTLSLRLSGIYGPDRTVLLERLKAGLASAPTTPVHWANRIHIDDAAAAVHHLLYVERPAPTYLVTDSTPLPMRTLYEYLAKLVGGPIPPQGDAPALVGSKRLSNARLLSTGFKLMWPDAREGYAALLQAKI